MKWIYILIVLVAAAFTLGCIDKNQAETTIANTDQTPAPGEDIFGTYSDLAEMDNISSDMDMQIGLSNEI